ncbi:unnamed protein product [Staurois parvus]|uniref:Uncharacterized protein n=1 Tax=Staurois parvus TaxID=386267 RepID=A0ABN9D3H3_9NEOB|nr:unnamed protein product [Staurois parvus]
MKVTVDDRCGDTEGDITNVSNIDSNVIDNVCIVDGNVGNANNDCDIHDETNDSLLGVTHSAVTGGQRYNIWGLSKGMVWIGLSHAQAQKIVP